MLHLDSPMTLRRKTLISLSLNLFVLFVLLFLTLRVLLVGRFDALEQTINLRDLNRAISNFHDDASGLGNSIADWSNWDDSYQFVQDKNSDFISSNLTDSALRRSALT